MFSGKSNKTPITTSDRVETIIGSGTTIKGNIIATGTIRIDGKLDGEIDAEGDLIIGQSGLVTGTIKGRNITIAGRLEGLAEAKGLLQLAATAVVNGDIVVESFSVEEGAKYKGNCQMKSESNGMEREQQPCKNQPAS